MEVRAALATGAGKPLSIETVNLDGPRAGEVLIEVKATGVCHTDAFTLSGEDPEGIFPAILGHEGAGIVAEVGDGVTSVAPGDHVIPLYVPECRQCEYCLSGKTNLCQSIRVDPGCGRDAGRLQPLLPRQRQDLPLHGHVDLRELHGGFRILGGEGSGGRPLRQDLLYRLRRDHRRRRRHQHGEGAPRRQCRGLRLGGIGLNVVQGARLVGANMIVGVDINPKRQALGERFGMTHFVNPKEVEGDLVPYLVDLTGGGADHSFECIGNVETMRQALECCHKGWGESTIIGVAGAGQEISTRPFQLVTGRVWRGTAFGGAKGRTDVPRIVDWYMDGKLEIDPMITHTMPLDAINDAFDLMHRGESIRSVVTF